MNREFLYHNNYAYAGITAIIYKVCIEQFFNFPDNSNQNVEPVECPIKEIYYQSLSDIGFEWKKHTSSTWNTVSIKKPEVDYFSTMDDIVIEEQSFSKAYCLNKLKIFPIHCLIKNLDINTEYDLRSYYISNEIKKYYNQQTISTISGECNIAFDFSQFDSLNISESFKEAVHTVCDTVLEIFKMFYVQTNQRTITIKYASGAGAASFGGNTLTYHTPISDIEILRTTTIHEMGHGFMQSNPSKEERIKFMEWATDAPHADWRWLGSHNYPVISSAEYGYIFDCIVCKAFKLYNTIM